MFNSAEHIALACIVASAAIMLSGLWFIRSFGCYALDRAIRAYREENTLRRQAEERTRQSHWRMVDEVSAKTDEATLAAERALASFIATQRIEHELVEKINIQRSA